MYDGNTCIPSVLTGGTLKYVYGLGLAFAVDTSGNVQVYHADGLGSVRAITNLDDRISVIETDQTDAFGNPTQTQGGISQPFQFTGQQRDASTGLYYLRARMDDPTIGRFDSQDPRNPALCGLDPPSTLNRYSYVENNPASRVDPAGQMSNRVGDDPPRPEPPPSWCYRVWTWWAGWTQVCVPGSAKSPARKNLWTCRISCIIAGGDSKCTGSATGTGVGSTIDEAWEAAYEAATADMLAKFGLKPGQKAGCYIRHCTPPDRACSKR